MNVGYYIRGEHLHIGTARVVKPNKCAQCGVEYKAGVKTSGCPKCAKGVKISEEEFKLPIDKLEKVW